MFHSAALLCSLFAAHVSNMPRRTMKPISIDHIIEIKTENHRNSNVQKRMISCHELIRYLCFSSLVRAFFFDRVLRNQPINVYSFCCPIR